MIRGIIKKLSQEICEKNIREGESFFNIGEVAKTPRKEFGDYSVSVTLKSIDEKEKDKVYQNIVEGIKKLNNFKKYFKEVNFVKPVFINFFLADDFLQKQVGEILKQKKEYGNLNLGKNQKINVEFISANPTGPLTLGNARGGFWGDVLANVLLKAGFKVEKVYYVNDYGNQIMTLGHSVLKDGEAKYQGDYIDWLNKEIKEKDVYMAGEKAAKLILEKLIKKTVKRMGIKFDVWIFENWLCKTGRVKKAMAILKKKDFLYEKDQALWFKSSAFGDQRDRVVIKKNDWYTYLAGDAGLHYYKFADKKFSKAINIWGADHFGDVPGLMGIVEALGHKGKLEILIHQFVTLFKGGQEFRMSKRAGIYVTMDELLDMAGLDAIRFFFLQKTANTHLNFDIDLAKEHSEKNPVFYVQYSHARICSILKKVKIQKAKGKNTIQNLKLLKHESELGLIKQLIRFPEIVEDTVKDYQVQRLPQYAYDLATNFNHFYRDCKVISENKELTIARINLILAAKIVLKNTLDLMGISSPEKM